VEWATAKNAKWTPNGRQVRSLLENGIDTDWHLFRHF
jgi:hypothetical protein